MITAMSLNEGRVLLGASGDKQSADLIHAEEDGSQITITWKGGSAPTAYTMDKGEDRVIGSTVKYFVITGGKFTIA